MRHRFAATVGVALAGLLAGAPVSSQTPLTVVTTAEAGPGSLRQALLDANATPGADVIAFDLPPGAPLVVTVLGDLPAVTGPVTIDATTQPGYAGAPVVGLALSGIADVGLSFDAGSAGSRLRGLAVYRDVSHFGTPAACVELRNTTDVAVEASHVGLTLAGDAQGCNVGVRVLNSPANRIGGPTPADRVIISGNRIGFWASGPTTPSSDSEIRNVFFGTDPTGQLARPNASAGILLGGAGGVADHAAGTQIVGCVVSGNGTDGHSGIRILTGATGSRVADSVIGLTASGDGVLGNGFHGVEVGAPGVTLEGNTIGGNASAGVFVSAAGATIAGNRIGTDPAGEAARPNAFGGIVVSDAAGVQILGNTVSGNGFHGVQLAGAGTTGAVLTGNRVGVTADGGGLLLNTHIQILVDGAAGTRIGGLAPGEGNLVGLPGGAAGGPGRGIVVFGDGAVGNTVQTPVGEALALAGVDVAPMRVAVDLAHDGPTANDPGDADAGPNGAQNHPDDLEVTTVTESILSGAYRIDSDAPLVLGLYLRLLVEADPLAGGDLYRLVSVGHDTYSATDHGGCGSPPCVKTFSVALPPGLGAADLVFATATDADGNTSEMSTPVVVVAADDAPGVPPAATLLGAHPNPFAARTTIRYDLPRAADVRLTVADLLGREVAVLVDARQDAGHHEVDLDGSRLAPGVYVYRLRADGVDAAGRVVRAR